jgi:paraquat-inducible protein B
LNSTHHPKAELAEVPHARITRSRRTPLIWLVPLIALIITGWLVFEYVHEMGPLIEIQFANGSGLQANQTVLKYKGVRIGEVRSVRLADDLSQVTVSVRLVASAKSLARDGSQFWIVRPQVGAGGLQGLETIVSGPYIQVQPGSGAVQKKFTGLEDAPVLKKIHDGIEIVLTTPEIKTLSIGSPLYYRGIEVGKVEYFELDTNSTSVKIHVVIKKSFTPLVRKDSKFWNAGGISVNLKFFGINFSAETFKSLIIGGIAFATPNSPGDYAAEDEVFPLNEKLDEKWLKWSPAITLSNASISLPQDSPSSLLLNSAAPETK